MLLTDAPVTLFLHLVKRDRQKPMVCEMRLQAILVCQIMFIGKGGLHPKRNKAICIVSGLSTAGEASQAHPK